MTSTVKVNNVQASDGGNIINQCGTTITIGASGDTINLATGASQSGFGRTGTVDWQTGDIKTGTFTAANGKGYFVNTTSGGVTATMPSSPSAGNIVAFADYAGTAGSNNITIDRNGSNMQGAATNGLIDTDRESVTFVYVDSTQGWVPVNDNNELKAAAQYVAATGGTVTTVCTNYKVHTFTGPGTFCVSSAGNPLGSNTVSYLVVGGGGGGANNRGGGGGAGGFREGRTPQCASYSASPLNATAGLPVSASPYSITVGGGATGIPNSPTNRPGNSGNVSTFSTITAAAGGFGGYNPSPTPGVGGTGGSGGGGGYPNLAGGAGNTPPVSPPQGNPGGTSCSSNSGSGGGGAGAAGGNGADCNAGAGGAGVATSINGTPTTRGGGGGGSGSSGGGGAGPGGGGAGYVGGGGSNPNQDGDANTGGGGGASRNGPVSGAGGSGIVIIRYKFQ